MLETHVFKMRDGKAIEVRERWTLSQALDALRRRAPD
jgi:hypothetical protein